MNLDDTARQAVAQLQREIDEQPNLDSNPLVRFERSLSRRTRNQRLGAVLVAGALTVLGVVFAVRALAPESSSAPAAPLPGGTLLYGQWDQRQQQARWFTVTSDGSDRADLHVLASCAVWFPDGDRILITDDADRGPGSPLRPAVIRPNGLSREVLDGAKDRDLELGCGDVSPDGSRLVLEGFNDADTRRNG